MTARDRALVEWYRPRNQTTCEPTAMLRWRKVPGEYFPHARPKVLEQLCIVRDWDAQGEVTDVRQEWREVPTEEA